MDTLEEKVTGIQMTSSVPTPKLWVMPVVVVAVVSVLVAALTFVTNLGTAAFQTLRAGTREVKTEIKASEARQQEDLRQAKVELRANHQAVTERLDRVFERLPAPPSEQ